MTKWLMYCHEYRGGYTHFGDLSYVERYDLNTPVLAVIVKEDANGDYMGWLENDSLVPIMITRKSMFDIQFAYGYKEKEKDGTGKAVLLSILKANED